MNSIEVFLHTKGVSPVGRLFEGDHSRIFYADTVVMWFFSVSGHFLHGRLIVFEQYNGLTELDLKPLNGIAYYYLVGIIKHLKLRTKRKWETKVEGWNHLFIAEKYLKSEQWIAHYMPFIHENKRNEFQFIFHILYAINCHIICQWKKCKQPQMIWRWFEFVFMHFE